jgi:hypothetical protein
MDQVRSTAQTGMEIMARTLILTASKLDQKALLARLR